MFSIVLYRLVFLDGTNYKIPRNLLLLRGRCTEHMHATQDARIVEPEQDFKIVASTVCTKSDGISRHHIKTRLIGDSVVNDSTLCEREHAVLKTPCYPPSTPSISCAYVSKKNNIIHTPTLLKSESLENAGTHSSAAPGRIPFSRLTFVISPDRP
jgi:hypothetical protein